MRGDDYEVAIIDVLGEYGWSDERNPDKAQATIRAYVTQLERELFDANQNQIETFGKLFDSDLLIKELREENRRMIGASTHPSVWRRITELENERDEARDRVTLLTEAIAALVRKAAQ